MKPTDNRQIPHHPFNQNHQYPPLPNMQVPPPPRNVWPQAQPPPRVPMQQQGPFPQYVMVPMPLNTAVPPPVYQGQHIMPYPGPIFYQPVQQPQPRPFHNSRQIYTHGPPPASSEVPCKKQNRAVPIVDPSTRKVVNENAPGSRPSQTKFNTEVKEFIPGSMRQATTSPQEPLKCQSPKPESVKSEASSELYVENSFQRRKNESHAETNVDNNFQRRKNEAHAETNVDNSFQRRKNEGHSSHSNFQKNRYSNNYNYNHRGPAPYKADKQVSTHHQSRQHQEQQHHPGSNNKGHFSGNSFNMPPQIPPFGNSNNQHNTNAPFRKQNQRNSLKSSSPPTETVQIQTSVIEKTIEQPASVESIPEQTVSVEEVIEVSPVIEIVADKQEEVPTKDDANDETLLETSADFLSCISSEKTVEITVIENPKQQIEEKTAHRYSVETLREMRCNPLVEKKPLPISHSIINPKLDRNVHRFLFDKGTVVNEKQEYRRLNNSFGKSGQLNKRGSGELRHSESMNISRNSGKHSLPTTPEKEVKLSQSENVKLNESKNAWKPSRWSNKENIPDGDRDVYYLIRDFRLLLNKLTEENYEVLIEEVKRFRIDDMPKLNSVVDTLFEKSISEPGYSTMYARLCGIVAEVATHSSADDVKNEKCKTTNSLKKSLISRCQQEFERSPEDLRLYDAMERKIAELRKFILKARVVEEALKGLNVEEHGQFQSEIEELEDQIDECNNVLEEIATKMGKTRVPISLDDEDDTNKIEYVKRVMVYIERAIDEFDNLQGYMRRRVNGTIKFIGELYKAELLTTKIMFRCIESLYPHDGPINEDNIDRLCKLLATIGPDIDRKEPESLNETFSRLKGLQASGAKYIKTSRIRFEIVNVIELRSTRWAIRENQRSSEICVMKLQDFQDKLDKEEYEHQLKLEEYEREERFQHHNNRRGPQNRHNHNNHNGPPPRHQHQNQNRQHGGQKYHCDKEGFTQVKHTNFDMNRFPTFSRGQSEKEIRLAPPAFLKPPQQQQTNMNPFSQLKEDSDGSDVLNHSSQRSQGYNNRNNRGRNNNGRGYNEQNNGPQSHQGKGYKITILPRPQDVLQKSHSQPQKPVIAESYSISKDELSKNFKAVYDGKLTRAQLMTKLKGFSVNENVLCEICCDLFDRKEPERINLMETILELTKNNFIRKNVVIGAFMEIFVLVSDIAIDCPHVYQYIKGYFTVLMKGLLLTKDDIADICEKSNVKDKFATLFETEQKVESISKEELSKNIKAVFGGKLTHSQLMVKMNGFLVNEKVLCEICCDTFDRKEDERIDLMETILELTKNNYINKKVVIGAFMEIFVQASDIAIDCPHVYQYIKGYFTVLMKGLLLTKDDIADICEKSNVKDKFSSLFETEEENTEPISDSSISFGEGLESTAVDEDLLDTTLRSPELEFGSVKSSSSSNDATESKSKGSESVDSKLCDDDYLQPPPDVKVGSFSKIQKKFEYALCKNVRKPNLDNLIKIVEEENCKYEKTFICEMTNLVLKSCCGKIKDTDSKTVTKAFGNSLEFIKRYVQVNNNIKPQLDCISAIQAFIYGPKSDHPELLQTLFEAFYDQEVISYDAFKIWQQGLSDNVKTDKAVMSTATFFQKIESGSE